MRDRTSSTKMVRYIRNLVKSLLVGGLLFSTVGVLSARLSPPQSQSRKTLTPIQWPDVTTLEPEVRAQLLGVEKSLTDVIHNASLPDAGRAAAYGDAGRIYHAYSLMVPARECYLNANLLAPKDFRWPYLLAKIDQQEGRVEEAIHRFEPAGALPPEYAAIDVNLGNIYLELNRADKAAASFEKALRQQPQNGAALYGLGQIA